jgi:hypothetical protein
MSWRTPARLALCALGLLLTLPPWGTARAQIEGNLSVYGPENARGYLQPLRDALSSGLGAGLYNTARIPSAGFRVRVEARAMLISMGDKDRTFLAHTEDYFPSNQNATAPTVVGSTKSVTVTDQGTGASFTFPGGLDLNRVGLAVPQVVVGGVKGTELMLRYIAVHIGDEGNELGDLSTFGIGARHSLSQYLTTSKVDLAAMLFYETLKLGDDFVDTSQLTLGVQASRRFRVVEPYAGLALNSFSMDMAYDAQQGGSSSRQSVQYDTDTGLGFTLGATLHMSLVHLNGELQFTDQTTLAFGLSVGM